eukprot:97643_1
MTDYVTDQLITFGFQPNEIKEAIKIANNPKDINEVMDIINDHNNNSINSNIQYLIPALPPAASLISIPKLSFNHNSKHSDLRGFDSQETQCNSTPQLMDCQCIYRVIQCAKFFNTLGNNPSQHQRKICQFFDETYTTLLDDYIHLTSKHHSDINKIMQQYNLTTCDLRTCTSIQRHH